MMMQIIITQFRRMAESSFRFIVMVNLWSSLLLTLSTKTKKAVLGISTGMIVPTIMIGGRIDGAVA